MRGEVFRLRAPKQYRGHEQAGKRYAVVLQCDDLPLSTVTVAPTSTSCRPASFRPEVEIDDTTTRVMVEQMTAVDRTRLGDPVGTLSASEIVAVDAAATTVLGLV